jgi:CubicO group peptidase (beta-lactamase class C family)
MQRRPFIFGTAVGIFMNQAFATPTPEPAEPTPTEQLEAASRVLSESVKSGQVRSATIVAHIGDHSIERAFGEANLDSSFLLGSISKPICVAALMSLYDKHAFQLTDLAQKYLPEFKGDGRERVTVQHLLTHVSGLPDQLPNNAQLRKSHAPLSEFVAGAVRVPLGFEPGTKYEYSSMAILLATEIAQRIAGKNFLKLVDENVFQPLNMKASAIGLGSLPPDSVVPVQTEHAAPEAGGGDPSAQEWDWNSRYWRGLGAPWGGVHASAGDVAKFLSAFVNSNEEFLSTKTAMLMIRNHNPQGILARGLGFALGPSISKNCSTVAFGHTGSTGTIAWLDMERRTGCVILTSLPGQAVKPHPRELAAEKL